MFSAFGLSGQSLEPSTTCAAESRPRVWWHWMNGNITKDGIRKDLQWFKDAGIGGFMVFDAGYATPQIVPQRLEYMTPEWKDALSCALQTADSLGLEVSIPSSAGWSLMGGPWVTPQDAMKKLTWRETTIEGNGSTQIIKLPEGYKVTGPFQDKRIEANLLLSEVIPDDLATYYEDIKVLAFPLASDDLSLAEMGASLHSEGQEIGLEPLIDGDITSATKIPINAETQKAHLDISLEKAQTLRSLSICSGKVRDEFDATPAGVNARLYVEKEDGSWKKVCEIPVGGAPLQTISFPATSGQRFRLELDRPAPDPILAMMGYAGPAPMEVNLGEFNLYTCSRVNHSEEKAGFMASHDLALYPSEATALGVKRGKVIDLTSKVDAEGNLTWKAPAGRWKILRLGWSLTGKRNHPASPEATGLEIDKLDKNVWRRYFEHYLEMYNVSGSEAIKYILTDSYESGISTWTPSMAAEFKARRGYDLTAWLPALTGQIVESGEATDRFLWDWRKTISELTAENYDLLTEIAKSHGLKGRYTESHEHGRLYVADGMEVKRSAAIPMAAIWAKNPDLQPCSDMTAAADIRESASVAHLYGQNIVASESFTVVGYPSNAWVFSPETLKPYADFAFSNGLNRVVIHTSPHQPVDNLKPGLSLTATGQWFDRHETWAQQASVWTDYLARTSELLQSGRAVADVLYYYGEDNNISALFSRNPPQIPAGYDFDYINSDALINLIEARDGKLVTPSGMSYSVLVLDDNARRMSLPVLRKIAKLASEGIIVCGAVPESVNSLNDNPKEFARLVKKTWHSGKSNVYDSYELDKVLSGNGIAPDATLSSSIKEGPAPRFKHRTLDHEGEIYWISNPLNSSATISASLRVSGLKPMLYNAQTGESREVGYHIVGDLTLLELPMEPHEALFVKFQAKATSTSLTLPQIQSEPLATEFGPWKVDFLSATGAPVESIYPDGLKSLTEYANPDIKYFSGTAIYSTEFSFDGAPEHGRVIINLGDVKNIAEIEINGKAVATLWKAPFKVDISEYLLKGTNKLVVRVTNLWRNRLIGDAQAGAKATTFTSLPFYTADAPLFPSGLIGPVELSIERPTL